MKRENLTEIVRMAWEDTELAERTYMEAFETTESGTIYVYVSAEDGSIHTYFEGANIYTPDANKNDIYIMSVETPIEIPDEEILDMGTDENRKWDEWRETNDGTIEDFLGKNEFQRRLRNVAENYANIEYPPQYDWEKVKAQINQLNAE